MSDEKETGLARRPLLTDAVPAFRMIPTTLSDALQMAKILTDSGLCPKQYAGKPNDALVAYEYGAALGLSWMQALRSIAVINGNASLWGDAIPALIQASGKCERFHEYFEGDPNTDAYTAVCVMKRKDMPDEVKRMFSIADAKTAKLWGKRGRDGQDTPWITYWQRMLQMRARSFAARDAFADELAGLIIAEEAQDYPDAIDAQVVSSEIVQTPPGIEALQKLPEALADNIEKAFTTLALAPGIRLAKLNEYLIAGKGTPEENAAALIEWCKNEYAARQGKTRGEKKSSTGNGKTTKPEAAGGASGGPTAGNQTTAPVSGSEAATATPAAQDKQAPPPVDEVFKKEPPKDLGF